MMFLRTLASAPRRGDADLCSHILIQAGDVPGGRLAVTWVVVAPWRSAPVRSCPAQQVYVVVAGRGVMHLEQDQRSVATGDLVYVPRHAWHRVENVGAEPLCLIEVCTPALDVARSGGAFPPGALPLGAP